MLLADRGYDADWIRELARQQGAWANIPPKRNRKDPIFFSPYLYRARNGSNGSSTKLSNVGVSRPDTPNSRPTIWRSSNSHESEFGYAVMCPRRSSSRQFLSAMGLARHQNNGRSLLSKPPMFISSTERRKSF
jgi:transposase